MATPETNPIGNESKTQPASKPWEQSWGSQDILANEPKVAQAAPPQQPPWAMAWGAIDTANRMVTSSVSNAAKGVVGNSLFDRVLKAESGNRHTDSAGNIITSPAGARGAAQLMPGTQRDPGFGIRPAADDSEAENRRVGREYLDAMVSRYDGDYEKALAAYNAGPGNVDKAITKGGSQWIDFLPKKRETIPYINKILGTNYSTRRKANG